MSDTLDMENTQKTYYVYNFTSRSNAVYGPFDNREDADTAIIGKKNYSVLTVTDNKLSAHSRVVSPEEL